MDKVALILSIYLAVLVSSTGCAPLVVGAVAGAAGGTATVAKESKSSGHSTGVYVGTVLANVVYFPAKVVFALGGAVATGAAYIGSGANPSVSNKVWSATVLGSYLVTPNMMEGSEKVRFIGP